MSLNFVSFDSLLERVENHFGKSGGPPDGVDRLVLVRDLFGILHVAVSDVFEESYEIQKNLQETAEDLTAALGPRASSAASAILFLTLNFWTNFSLLGLKYAKMFI